MENNQKPENKITKIVVALSIVIAAISLYVLLVVELPNKPLAGQGGIQENEALIGGDFTLTDYDGKEFNSDMMKGRLSIVYFGFTFCPDICPTSLQKLAQILSTLDKYNIDVLPIFITVDPARDTTSLLKEYLGHFHPKIIGLTGSDEQIKNVADLYKVYYAVAEGATTEDDKYMLDHTSFMYIMGKDGKYMKHFYMNSTAEEMIDYIRINK